MIKAVDTDINPHCTAISNSVMVLPKYELDKLKKKMDAFNSQ